MKVVNSFTYFLPISDFGDANRTSRITRGVCGSFVSPVEFKNVDWVHLSKDVLELIGWQDFDKKTLLAVLSGQKSVEGFASYAMCYGGHQFGSWAGQLGDGRAITIAEVVNNNKLFTIQLKGVGRTAYSRGADGFAVLRSSVREYLCSEAMHHLGVPTTRALSLILSGEEVLRDELYNGNPKLEKGAVVARVAPTFIRFGNFELLAARNEIDVLKKLADYTIDNFYPEIKLQNSVERYVSFFETVVNNTKELIVHWQRVGFVHGVMNTDNMSILGLTIDYGPYGWLEDYTPNWTPNITDAEGKRYAFANQYSIALWNLTQLANALYPLIKDVEPLKRILRGFKIGYQEDYYKMMLLKLGIDDSRDKDESFVVDLVRLMEQTKVDMTLFFRNLNLFERKNPEKHVLLIEKDSYLTKEVFSKYKIEWKKWLGLYAKRIVGIDEEDRIAVINRTNPKYVLRNYMAQMAIERAEKGDYSLIETFYAMLSFPYDEQPEYARWFAKRPDWALNKVGSSMLSCSS